MNNLTKNSPPSMLVALLTLVSLVARLDAGEWPQILGPTRNGKAADDERLASHWPAAGPKVVWQKRVGRGFAGVAVARGRTFLFHRQADRAICEALDAHSGEPIWQAELPTSYVGTYVSDDGPRCVPIVAGEKLILYGAEGDLHCLAFADGKKLWSRELYRELGTPRDNFFGAGSSPLVEGDLVLVNVGTRAGAGLVACSLADGHTVWQATNESASYSSPVATTVAGVRHAIFVTRLNVVSVDPTNGAERFRLRFGSLGPTVNAANPLVVGDRLFVTANYGVGARCLKIGGDRADEVWQGEALSSQYSTSIERDGYLYGVDGRQDLGVARLRCLEFTTGNVQWTENDFGMATLILADGKLIIQKTSGELVLAEPSPQAFHPLATAKPFDSTVQALPALGEGLYYARDGRTLKCLDLRASDR